MEYFQLKTSIVFKILEDFMIPILWIPECLDGSFWIVYDKLRCSSKCLTWISCSIITLGGANVAAKITYGDGI